MFWVRLAVIAALVAPTVALPAQRGGELPPPPIGQKQTPFEQMADRLDLDRRTQFPEAEVIFIEATRVTPPVAQAMQQARIRMVNAALEKNEADATAALDAYREAAARMATIEAEAFAKVFALLRPNQQSRAGEAFALIAGMFIPPPPAAARGGRRGGGA
jgi:hypothetical protein